MRFSLPEWLLLAAVVLTGCNPEIGDACSVPSDCSRTGSRICEPEFPGGYCTIFNCSPNKCPEEAVCTAYGSTLSSVPECSDPTEQRLQRTFCMRACDSDSDCRTDDGYACVNLSDPEQNPWGAVVVDRGSRHRICAIPASPPPPGPHETTVCHPPLDASFPPEPDGARPPVVDAGADAATDGSGPDASADAATDGSGPDASADAADAAPDVKDAQGGS